MSPERRSAQTWLGLAVGVLLLAGAFALLLVIGRMPPFDTMLTDPLLFRRGLVIHVDLSLVVWFYAFTAALIFLLPGRGRSAPWTRWSPFVGGAGVAVMVLAGGMPGAEPVLSNYIPMIDHPLYALGLLLFGLGVLSSFADARLWRDDPGAPGVMEIPDAARPGLRVAGWGLLLAAITLAVSLPYTATDLSTQAYYEFLLWGPGHVLQVASEAAMMSVWLLLLHSALNRPVVSQRTSRILFGVLLAPWVIAPWLAAQGTATGVYRTGFTRLMQWGVFPVVTVVLVLCLVALYKARRDEELPENGLLDARILAFWISAGLTVLGFVLGAMIRGSNTIIPAHYHAAIGGVTASFMGVTYVLLAGIGMPLRHAWQQRAARWQPVLFGVGQMVFASGFAFAGAHGMARKTYGAEQAGRSLDQTLGLAVMGTGGLIAVAGGVLFLFLFFSVWRAGAATAVSARPSALPSLGETYETG